MSGELPIQPYNRGAIREALTHLPRPGGGTAIGEAMRTARPDLYRAGVFRKYLLVVTDGDNTAGRSPDDVARDPPAQTAALFALATFSAPMAVSSRSFYSKLRAAKTSRSRTKM